MRTLIPILIIFFTFPAVYAQENVSDSIITALSKGNSVTLSNFFNENIELKVGTANDVYNKKQATAIVGEFFRQNKIQSFKVLHKGSKENSAFAICSMQAGKSNYRVYILVRKISGKQLIQQLRIEFSNE